MSVASRVRGACAALTLCSAIGMSSPTTAAEMPAYMGIMVAGPSPGETARQNVLARGFWQLWGFTTPGFDEAEAMFRRAIELEPGLPRAHAGLSYVLLQKTFHGDPRDRPELLSAAMAAARVSVGLDERDPLCRCVLGRAYCLHRQYDDAIAE